MANLIITPDQLTFPWRDRARICPKCQGKGGEPWLSARRDAQGQVDPRKLLPCIVCRGTGELIVEEGKPA